MGYCGREMTRVPAGAPHRALALLASWLPKDACALKAEFERAIEAYLNTAVDGMLTLCLDFCPAPHGPGSVGIDSAAL